MQAEDGIRYFHVTGVQTCALPICFGPSTEGTFQCCQTPYLPGARAPSCSSVPMEVLVTYLLQYQSLGYRSASWPYSLQIGCSTLVHHVHGQVLSLGSSSDRR